MRVFPDRVRRLSRRGCIGPALLVAGIAFVLPVGSVSGAGPAAQATSSVLVNGAQLHGANGVIVGPDGRLRVASSLGSEIVEVNRLNGAIVARSGISNGVQSPDDLRFGPDGSLYWVSILTGNVVRRTPSGNLKQQFIGQGVDGITFSTDGRLFVSLDFFGDALYEVDPALTSPPRLIAQNLGFLNGMDWGRDGRLYAPVWTQHRVVSIDVDSCTDAVDPYVQCDIRAVADGFFIPAGVKFDRLGRLYAVDQNGDVVRIDVVTGKRKLIATLAPGLDNLAFDASGDLYVSSASDGFVVRIDASGRVTPLLRSGLILPAGAAVVGSASRESIYVADGFTLRKFNATTGELLDQDSTFLAVSALQAPATVSADGSALLLTSWLGNAVQVWNPATKTLLESYSDFAVPLNAIRFRGDIVVAELGFTPGTARVVRQTSSGRVTLAAMNVPSGLAAAGGDLWAADYANGTLLQLVANGVTLSPPIKVAAGLKQPEGLAVDSRGRLLVVESGTRRLLRIDPSTRSISVVLSNLKVGLEAPTGTPPTFALSSVAVGSSGAIYVSGDEGNLIYKDGP